MARGESDRADYHRTDVFAYRWHIMTDRSGIPQVNDGKEHRGVLAVLHGGDQLGLGLIPGYWNVF